MQSLLVPIPVKRMKGWPVSTLVNSPRNDTPECVAPLSSNLELDLDD